MEASHCAGCWSPLQLLALLQRREGGREGALPCVVCEEVAKRRREGEQAMRELGVRLVVVMAAREWGRGSNTAVLGRQMLGAEILVADRQEDEVRFQRIVEEAGGGGGRRVCILFPSRGALSVAQWLRRQTRIPNPEPRNPTPVP